MTSLHTMLTPQIFSARRTSRWLFMIFGTLFCFFAVVLQCVQYPDWASRAGAFLLLTLPVGAFGLYFLRAGWMLRQSRVMVSDTGVELQIPNWKDGWLFRSVPVQLRWDEICCVRHEQRPLLTCGKAIDHYWIHSARGTFLLTPDLCREAAEVARLIAERKGCALTEVAPDATPQPRTSAQEEASLKRNAIAVIVILCALCFGIVLAVTPETAVGQMVQRGLWLLSQFLNLFFIVLTVASIFGLWWRARRERSQLKKQLAEKM
ncbi:MAG TPA: hypothetical protein VFZ34_10835 [Blastocatellia bacterium]|nr:hypothetical protein [Blastocatellia bacterium]